MNKNTQRINANLKTGLSSEQAKKRFAEGLYNKESTLKTKTFGRIVRDNVLTLFNFINVALAVAIFYVGSYENALFMFVVIFNTLIGIIQEIRAKITIDKMSIISMTKVKVIRDGNKHKIPINEIVLDDIIELTQGDQVPTDCILVDGVCEVNESLLTGESDAIFKQNEDKLMSGSFLVSGTCLVRADRVGEDNYASKISNEAKYVKKVNSEIMQTLNKIIRIVSICIIPLGCILFFRQINIDGGVSLKQAVESTVAALIGMIPEGLILLTSTVLAVSVIRLSKYKVLVQELYCIETLARVDTLCLDKTGTITEGCMEVYDLIPYTDVKKEYLEELLSAYSAVSKDENPTMCAIKERFKKNTSLTATQVIAFSSDKKWSGVTFKDNGAFVLGAEEFIFGANSDIKKEMNVKVEDGYRVLVVACSGDDFNNRELPSNLKPVGLVVIKDKIRKEAKKTLEYFSEQGVDLKIISGDNVKTVAAIAKEAGLKTWSKYVDATTLTTDSEINDAAIKYSVFGRVTPKQKYKLVKALKKAKHTVAMTGDGVNDVLALKEADCSVAMASGSDAARSVSQLVLLDSNFASMPKVVAEGRRTINNIQRSASLFLVKTVYSFLLTIIFILIGAQYPFEPIQMTLISAFTIGMPSFILALEPNKERIKGRFFDNIMSKAIPGGVTVTLSMLVIVIVSSVFSLDNAQSSTLSVITTAFIGLLVLWKISQPFEGAVRFIYSKENKKRKIKFSKPKNLVRFLLFCLMAVGLSVGVLCFKEVFRIVSLNWHMLTMLAITVTAAILIYILLVYVCERIIFRKNKLL